MTSLNKVSRKLLEKAKPGDIIKFKRRLYSHYGIYDGHGNVIHKWGPNIPSYERMSNSMQLSGRSHENQYKSKIVKTDIETVAGEDGEVSIENYLDSKLRFVQILFS